MRRRLTAMVERIRAPWQWLQRAIQHPGREREGVVQSVKMALAAVLAWFVAQLLKSPQAFIAPYVAVFLMSGTVYRSLLNAVQQVAALLVGILLAFVAATVIGQPLAALGVVVLVGMLIGQWHKLGDNGVWVGVIGLLMLTYGTADQGAYLVDRVRETVLGAAIGVSINMLLLPPVHLHQARDAVAALAGEVERLLCSIADELRKDWQHSDARTWVREAWALNGAIHRADERMAVGVESTRLNARRLLWRRGGDGDVARYRPAIEVFRELSTQIQRMVEALAAGSDNDDGQPVSDIVFGAALADALESLAAAAVCFRQPLDQARSRDLDERLNRLGMEQNRLARGVEGDGQDAGQAPNARGAVALALGRAMRAIDDYR